MHCVVSTFPDLEKQRWQQQMVGEAYPIIPMAWQLL